MNSFNEIQTIPQPKNLSQTLFQHQLVSIFNMEKLESDNIINIGNNKFKKTKVAINGDLQGYGKTLSMIGLIIRDKMTWDIETPYVFEKIKIEANGMVNSYEIIRYNKIPTTLVLVSQSIIGQWVDEIKKSNLNYICIKTKQDLIDVQVDDYNIVLVIPTMYNKLVTLYSKCAWKRFIFDEPGNLKVPGMLSVQAGFNWFVTATPIQIFNHHYKCGKGSFMRDIIGSSYSDFEILLKDITIKNHPDFIKASFEMPKTYHHYHSCYNPIYNVVYNFVTENVKNMIEAGNIEGAILALGGDKTCNIVELILQKKNNELQELNTRVEIYKIRNAEEKIKELDVKKARLNIQINELESKFKNMLNENCNICCEPLKNPVLETNCQNLFCGECLLTWFQKKNTCPLCRVEVDTRTLIYIKTNDKEDTKIISKSAIPMTKLEKIIDIIQSNITGKYLIFSDHDGSYNSIKHILAENDISCVQIRGNIKTREKNLDSFKNGDVQVIFLNSKYNGAGINLQESTDIIIYHEMNFNTESQIIGRANRIGRKIPLNVHHLQIK